MMRKVCEASHRMGKWLAPNAVHCSHGLEGTKRALIQLIICLTNVKGITSKSKHIVKYPDWPSAIWPVPHSEEVHVPKPLEKLSAMTTLILMKKRGQC